MIIAIDGPAGSGKSTTAKFIAKKLNYRYIDSGAMYRAVAWSASNEGIDLDDENTVGQWTEKLKIEFFLENSHCTGSGSTSFFWLSFFSRYFWDF